MMCGVVLLHDVRFNSPLLLVIPISFVLLYHCATSFAQAFCLVINLSIPFIFFLLFFIFHIKPNTASSHRRTLHFVFSFDSPSSRGGVKDCQVPEGDGNGNG